MMLVVETRFISTNLKASESGKPAESYANLVVVSPSIIPKGIDIQNPRYISDQTPSPRNSVAQRTWNQLINRCCQMLLFQTVMWQISSVALYVPGIEAPIPLPSTGRKDTSRPVYVRLGLG